MINLSKSKAGYKRNKVVVDHWRKLYKEIVEDADCVEIAKSLYFTTKHPYEWAGIPHRIKKA